MKERKGSTKSGRLLKKYTSKYSEVHKEVKRRLRKDKRSHYEHLATEAEEAISKGERGELYRITRQIAGKFSTGCPVVKSKDGVKITAEKNDYNAGQNILKKFLTG